MEEDIKLFNKIVNLQNKEDLYEHYFCWLYPFTNENISGYFDKINFKNKKVLTVTSSGDHVLNSLLLGADEVDAFDINPLAKYYSELKIAAVKSLDFNEFFLFFYNKKIFNKNKFFMDKKTYLDKICKNLNGNYRKFWDYVFEHYKSKELNDSFLFSKDYLELKGLMEANNYFNEYDYNRLKKILKDKPITYHDVNVKDLAGINKKFDIITLSNVPACIDDIFVVNALKYLKNILEQLKHDKTQIILNYFYYNLLCESPNKEISIYNPYEVNKYFGDYDYISFESSDNLELSKLSRKLSSKKDKVLILK